MVFFQFLRSQVQSVSSGIGQQQQIASGVLDTIKGYIPKVQSAWIGGDADAFTRQVIGRVQADGTCWLSGTTWHGMAAMRISIVNWSTTEEDIDRSLAAILEAARAA